MAQGLRPRSNFILPHLHAYSVTQRPRMRRLAQAFTIVGVAIAVIGVGAYTVGFRPSTLPAALLDISVYKLVFVAAGCLIAAGAAAGRAVRRRDERTTPPAPIELPEGRATEAWHASDKAREDVTK